MYSSPNKKVQIQDWGLIGYSTAWERQEQLFNSIISEKLSNRNLPHNEQKNTPNYVVLCSHPHVYTLGKSGKREHLLIKESQLYDMQISYVENNRGGDITYHGPGQLVVYPILDLENFFTDIHKYLRMLEEAVIKTLAHWNIAAGRLEGLTGVWVDVQSSNPRKICAMGVRSSRWVVMHGLALNVEVDLSYFSHIIPCGISDKAVTSMHLESANPSFTFSEVKKVFLQEFMSIFEMECA